MPSTYSQTTTTKLGCKHKTHRILVKCGRPLNQSRIHCSVNTEKHRNQISLHSKKEARISLPLKITGYKSSVLIHRTVPGLSTGEPSENSYLRTSKCERLSNQQEAKITNTADKCCAKDDSHNFDGIPEWLEKSVKPIQNYFLEECPKLMASFPRHVSGSDDYISMKTYEAVNKALKDAKANLPNNLEEIFSKLGLGSWIKEYKDALDKDEILPTHKDVNSQHLRQKLQNLTDLDENESSSQERLKKRCEKDHSQRKGLNPNTTEKNSIPYPSTSFNLSRGEHTFLSFRNRSNILPPQLSKAEIEHTGLDLLSLRAFDQLATARSSMNSVSYPINNKIYRRVDMHSKLMVRKEILSRNSFPRSPIKSPSKQKYLNNFTLTNKRQNNSVWKFSMNNINFNQMDRNIDKTRHIVQTKTRLLGENPVLKTFYVNRYQQPSANQIEERTKV
ncbi:unnamed protein product [Heterobilharzia americana]|nr:unnamed protein product [Heterobilharzia americana]